MDLRPGDRSVRVLSLSDLADAGAEGLDLDSDGITRAQFADGGRLFLAIGNANGEPRSHVVSVSLTGDLDLENVQEVSLWSITGSTMVYVPPGGTAVPEVVVRDLDTDAERTLTIPETQKCTQAQLYAMADRLIVRSNCAADDDPDYSRLQVFDFDGDSIDTLQDRTFVVIGTTSKFLTLRSNDPSGHLRLRRPRRAAAAGLREGAGLHRRRQRRGLHAHLGHPDQRRARHEALGRRLRAPWHSAELCLVAVFDQRHCPPQRAASGCCLSGDPHVVPRADLHSKV